jgi:uncharacterized membrane protein YfcA
LIPVAGVLFVAAFIRSALGFGDAVVAMPLLAMAVGLRTATPLVAFVGPTISLLILARDWRRVERARLVFESTTLALEQQGWTVEGRAIAPEA